MPRLPLICACLIALGVAWPAHADQVTMRNGDRLTGKVLHKTTDILVLRTSYAGDLKLRTAEIDTLTTDEPLELLMDDGTFMRVRLTPPEEGETDAQSPQLAKIRYINPTPEESGRGYNRSGHAALGFSQVRGNSENDLYHADTQLVLRAIDHRFTLNADGNYGRDGGIASTSNWRAGTRYDKFFQPKEFLYAKFSLENDRYKDIRRRSQTGGGYGYQIYEDDATTLNLRGGLAYITVNHYDIASEHYTALTWGLDLRHKLQFFAGEVFHTEEGTRALDNQHGTVLQTKTGLRLPLSEQISATAQVNTDWESKPAPDRKETDTTLMFGLGYAFR